MSRLNKFVDQIKRLFKNLNEAQSSVLAHFIQFINGMCKNEPSSLFEIVFGPLQGDHIAGIPVIICLFSLRFAGGRIYASVHIILMQ